MAMGEFAYAMNSNRFLAAAPLQKQDFAIVGIPFDGAVTNRPGARFGPAEVRRASLMLCDGIHPHFDVSPLEALGDGGDMRLPNASPLAEVRAIVQSEGRRLMARQHCVFIGGDHSVTLPLLRAARAQHGPLALVAQIVQRLGNRPCYLTLDIDCLDPAFAPGTGTPEPGGLSSSQVLTLLEDLAVLHTVAMDCVEVAPAYDHAELTSQAACAFIWTYLCGQVAKRHAAAGACASEQGA